MNLLEVTKKFIQPLLSTQTPVSRRETLQKKASNYCSGSSNHQELTLRKRKLKTQNVVVLKRTQPFKNEEQAIVEKFLEFIDKNNLSTIASGLENSVYSKVLELSIFAVALESVSNELFIKDLSDLCDYWSNRTYEGNKVSFAIKIPDVIKAGHADFFKEYQQDYFASLSNGVDECIEIKEDGEIKKVVFCNEIISKKNVPSAAATPSVKRDQNVPLRFLELAQYAGKNGVVSLTRNSEILIMKKGSLWSAKRNQQWIVYSHDAYLKKMSLDGGALSASLREAMYQTALDTSFTKTGAILAMLFYDSNTSTLIDALIGSDKRLTKSNMSDSKIRSIMNLISDEQGKPKKFQELSRPLRAELASMDGAFIFTTTGDIKAIGTIINLDVVGKNNGGGRSAATKNLAKYGLAMKISNDTYIECYGTKKALLAHRLHQNYCLQLVTKILN